ncbi:MAG: VOC family protein [Alphaproteobacteria bacterium]|uniref:VOC family protein n=1 Tax=Hyphomonas sp. TaxID=87 RepID=UPI001E083417|nr:VOC family protein [Hyphomonas sp.]MBU3922585.1 VOC family protein [Alphaproteobacteria bacterium]MBU4060865.1 VOC family protein [Alphaproteobacteria bacterium]MBU4164849.1 VOC family protein [Alphaproteobacteria bacterium]MBU4568429.1 VOC family protein [Alphaproteobacteria bacterium]
MGKVRLRQLVIAAETLDVADQLAGVLGLGAPFPDPGVAEFGLVNRVYALGDQFLEVVVPTALTASVGRFLARGGDGGYMAIFQTDDLASARARADALNIRRVWNADLKDISASHLHPADMGAAIVSIDEARPAGSWRWGGPDWEGRSVPGRLTGAVIHTSDPERMAARWAEALGVTAKGAVVELADATLEFRPGTEERIVKFLVSVPDAGAALARARELGLGVVGSEARIGGVGIVLDG